MNVNSYIFQSPYSSPVQVGRPDPAAKKDESQSMQKNIATQSLQKEKLPVESSVKPTLNSGVSINLTALGGNAQTTVAGFKSLSAVNQAQKAYVGTSVS